MKINEDYSAVTVSGQHVWGILDTNIEKQINSDAEDCNLINKHVLMFRTLIRHSQFMGCNCHRGKHLWLYQKSCALVPRVNFV